MMANDLGQVEQLSLPSSLRFDDLPILGDDRRNKSLYDASSSSSSEEEDCMAAELNQKMVSSFSLDEEPLRDVAGSPQSTLCSWLASSSKGRSDGGDSPVEGRRRRQPREMEYAWDRDDLLPEAAGQVAFSGTDPTSPAQADAASQIPPVKKTSGTGYFVSPILTHRQLQAEKFYRLKQLQIMKQQLKSGGGRGCRSGGQLMDLSPTAWPPLQKQQQIPPPPPAVGTGNGMRAVLLKTSSGAKKESTGTGVFLPRIPDGAAAAEPPKKPNATLSRRKSQSLADHKQPAAAEAEGDSEGDSGSEICLPREWTY